VLALQANGTSDLQAAADCRKLSVCQGETVLARKERFLFQRGWIPPAAFQREEIRSVNVKRDQRFRAGIVGSMYCFRSQRHDIALGEASAADPFDFSAVSHPAEESVVLLALVNSDNSPGTMLVGRGRAVWPHYHVQDEQRVCAIQHLKPGGITPGADQRLTLYRLRHEFLDCRKIIALAGTQKFANEIFKSGHNVASLGSARGQANLIGQTEGAVARVAGQ
jgi:hypothetical protein